MGKVYRWHAELFDAVFLVLLRGPAVFFAGVDDAFDADRCHVFYIASKWESAKHNVIVDFIPPVADFQPPSQKHVPAQRWVEDRAGIEPAEAVLRFGHAGALSLLLNASLGQRTANFKPLIESSFKFVNVIEVGPFIPI